MSSTPSIGRKPAGSVGGGIGSLSAKLGAKSKAGTPPDKLRASGLRTSNRPTDVNVEGIVSINALISQFRDCMADLLDERMSAIVVEVEMAKQVCSDLDRRVQDLEQENRQLRSAVDFLSQQETERTQRTADILVGESATPVRQDPALGPPSDWQEVVRHIVRSEKEVEAHQHNVVLSGVPEEMELDEVTSLLLRTIPGLEGEVRNARRLGRATSDGTPRNRPRLVKVELTASGKVRLWQGRRGLKHGESPIYVNNDLSFDERKNRKAVLPKYKALRAAGVRCSLPRDTILQDGTPIKPGILENALRE